MTWPAKTYIKGDTWNASQGNEYIRDPLGDLRAGGLALSGQTAQDFIHVSTAATQLGRLAAVSGKIPWFNGATNTWQLILPAESSWPVGIVYRLLVATNPATLLGFGSWALLGPGRCTVGYDAADEDFDAAEKLSGSKTITLTIAELPSHTHVQNAHDHTATNLANTTTVIDFTTPTVVDNSGTKTSSSVAATNQYTGGGGAHNNVQPSIACYIWARTA